MLPPPTAVLGSARVVTRRVYAEKSGVTMVTCEIHVVTSEVYSATRRVSK